jgi:hypothetical protein
MLLMPSVVWAEVRPSSGIDIRYLTANAAVIAAIIFMQMVTMTLSTARENTEPIPCSSHLLTSRGWKTGRKKMDQLNRQHLFVKARGVKRALLN